jgi:hypothetical protein
MQYFETKVKYTKTTESGRISKITENYLVKAVSFTDAEAIITTCMNERTSSEFVICSIKPSQGNEILACPETLISSEKWFKARIAITDEDDFPDRETKDFHHAYINAEDLESAQAIVHKAFEECVFPYEIANIGLANIVGVMEPIAAK